jgi:hypothetical protein
MVALIKKKTDSAKEIKIRDIKNGPPSLNLLANSPPIEEF